MALSDAEEIGLIAARELIPIVAKWITSRNSQGRDGKADLEALMQLEEESAILLEYEKFHKKEG